MIEEHTYNFRSLGFIRSPYKQKFGTPRQAALTPGVTAYLELNTNVVPPGSLEGLERYSHIWVLYFFHLNKPGNPSGKVKPPRLKGQKMGMLATRSPHHSNPIGMSLCRLKKVDAVKNTLWVEGVDAVDGTPIIDIKPYIAAYDSAVESHDPWDKVEQDHLSIEYSDQATQFLQTSPIGTELKTIIDQSLCRDIRDSETGEYASKVYRTNFLDTDVHFSMTGDHVKIQKILPKTL